MDQSLTLWPVSLSANVRNRRKGGDNHTDREGHKPPNLAVARASQQWPLRGRFGRLTPDRPAAAMRRNRTIGVSPTLAAAADRASSAEDLPLRLLNRILRAAVPEPGAAASAVIRRSGARCCGAARLERACSASGGRV